MLSARRHSPVARVLAVACAVAALLLGSDLTDRSAGDVQDRIAADRSAATSLQAAIAVESARIAHTTNGLRDATRRLTAVEGELSARETQLRVVQSALLAARNHLVDVENRLQRASRALADNLVASYEGDPPDTLTVVLESHGFSDLLERLNFMQRIRHYNAEVITATRTARAAVARQATTLAALEQRDTALTHQVLAQRDQVAALQAALLSRRITETSARSRDAAKLRGLGAQLKSLEARAAAQASRAAATGSAHVGPITVNTAGMVQPPAGAPAAVAQVIAAGNAIATLPYVYGGGHGSFHANGYDCSGSVSYALAAAGLVSAPMTSGGYETWGDPGPGRWISVYANAGHVWMQVAGWRFDTVALGSGTRWSQSGGEYAGFVVRHPPGL
jgi:cell wall-associated NlpC family hydrolase